MKKNILLLLLILFSINVMSQEKGSYLTISGGVGPTGYKYNMTGVNFADPKCELKLGGQLGVGYSYYFTKYFGISTGIGVSHYRTHGRFMGDFSDENYFSLGNYTDNDPFLGHVTDYELRVRTQDWTEQQSGYFAEIPLMLNFQVKFGENEYWGMYFGLGAKFQIPFKAEYSIIDGDHEGQPRINISGYYPERNLELGHYGNPPIAQHGFGKIHNPSEVLANAQGDLDFKFNVSAVGELGFLFSLSRRVDLSLGAFIDYGLLNINKKEQSVAMFTGPTEQEYTDLAEGYNVANGIKYSSMITSDYVNDVTTMSYGGKIGIRIKLGKLSERPVPEPCENDTIFIHTIEETIDTVYIEVPVEVEVIIDEPELKYDNNDIYILLEPIYFDLDKAILKNESIEILNKKVEVLNKYPEIRLVVLGNTCDLGNDPYNYKLGQRRADVAKKYLTDHGINPDRLETVTQSRFEPEMPNTTEFNRSHNRRDDFRPLFPGE
ncbi:OmpA family protein [Bacteroidales bacterium OttesenSCG-928-K03]|nr:OmpA family protein [Odoribacter sp. OttesenSCG-928-L07]MDL2239414.1 OmpA family protein [Bacteroidales bacterium OttesenSCG-928-L14]MDL2241131.1 OmpA family protein [Bacteroidales bacterium OttesenSCG-928-K22]MDL2242899.1 OmpA family protein [Bacteroidales bacterium OttesenSCG-928-K03]